MIYFEGHPGDSVGILHGFMNPQDLRQLATA